MGIKVKFEHIVMFVMLGIIIFGFLGYDHKISKLEGQLAEAKGVVDTVQVEVRIHDTAFVTIPDTVVESSDTVRIGDTVVVNHYPILVDLTEQPLFSLKVRVDTRKPQFSYDYRYNPLFLTLRFQDKYDLRKGFTAELTPNIGTISVDWGEYKPLPKKWGLTGSLGLGYSKLDGVFALGDITLKKTTIGALMRDGSTGFYIKRTLFSW